VKEFIKKFTPPVFVSLLRRIRGLRVGSPHFNEKQLALRAEYERRSKGLAPDEVPLREGLTLKAHPDSREPFEAFCWIFPQMVAEMDCFLERTKDRRRLLDVGALHGVFSLAFTSQRPETAAVAVDASPYAFARLLYNTQKNRRGNVTPVECALSAAAGTLQMYFIWQHACGGRVPVDYDRSKQPIIPVEMRTGDDLCSSLSFEPDVIKIDVEGHELKVLKGLEKTIQRLRPLIFLELHPRLLLQEDDSLGGVAGLLADYGYQASFVDGRPAPLERFSTFTENEWVFLTPS
jgi:FkbM family methyltransferase